MNFASCYIEDFFRFEVVKIFAEICQLCCANVREVTYIVLTFSYVKNFFENRWFLVKQLHSIIFFEILKECFWKERGNKVCIFDYRM